MEKILQPIIPDEKDIQRAKDMIHKQSQAQIESNINRIKDPLKVAKRWVAYHQLSSLTPSEFNWHLQSLVSKDSDLWIRTQHTLSIIDQKRREKYQREDKAKQLTRQPIKDILNPKIINKIKEWPRNKILNTLGLNKKCFGTEIRVNKVNYRFNHYLGYGQKTKLQLQISFEHLEGYFFKEMGYSLCLNLHVMQDGTSHFKTDYWNNTKFRLGKKDTHTLLNLLDSYDERYNQILKKLEEEANAQ